MNRGLRRRLDVLIWLCSALLGIVLTYVLLSSRAGFGFLLFTLVPTVIIAALAFWYVGSAPASETEERADF